MSRNLTTEIQARILFLREYRAKVTRQGCSLSSKERLKALQILDTKIAEAVLFLSKLEVTCTF
jgi:hypothetical protein